MQKVGVIRSIRSNIKAEKKDKEKNKEITKGFYCSILNFDHDFHIFFPTGL